MLVLWLMIGLVVWIPLLFYGIERRGFVILLIWLFVAPIVANLLEFRKDGFVASQGSQRISSSPLKSERDWRILIAPNRLIFGAFVMVFVLHSLLKKKRLGPFDNSEKWMAAFAAILLANLVFQSDSLGYDARVAADAFLVPFLAYFVTRRLVKHENHLNKLTLVLGYMASYLIMMALYQGLFRPDVVRVTGPFVHRDYLYVVIVVVFFMALAHHLSNRGHSYGRSVLPHWLRLVLIVLIPVIVLLTWTRGNWLGFGIGASLFMVLSFRLMNLRRGMIVVALIAMLVPISLVGWQIVSPPEHVEERVSNEQNIYARLAAWQAVLGSGLDSPFFGIGFGKTRDLLDSTSVRVAGVKNLSSTHNSFLTLFAELGVVGLFTYIGLVGSFVRAGVLLYKRGVHAQARWRGIGVLSILAAHLVPAFFSNIIFSPVVSHIYVFTFFGAVAALCDSPVQIRGSRYGRYTQRVKGQIGNTRAA